MTKVQTHDPVSPSSRGERRTWLWVLVAIVFLFVVLPVLAVAAITILGQGAETKFVPVGSSIG